MHMTRIPLVKSTAQWYHRWVWAGRRTAERRGGAQKDGTSTGLLAQKTTVPFAVQRIIDNCPERLFGITSESKSYVNQ